MNFSQTYTDATLQPIVQSNVQGLIKVPVSALNALDPAWPQEMRNQILAEKYRAVTYQDALVTGNAFIDPQTGHIHLKTKRNLATFKGFVFEALVARQFREDPIVKGKRGFAWCTQRSFGHITDDFIYQYVAYVSGDKSLEAQELTSILYNTSSPFDVGFYRRNEQGQAEVAMLVGQQVAAGIQVKAILGNELPEIIKKMITGRYRHVLTMLKYPNGQHSYEVCMNMLHSLFRKGDITGEQFQNLTGRLNYPQALGIDQQMIDEYSYYLDQIYSQGGNFIPEIYEAVSLEAGIQLVESQRSILVPTQQPIVTNGISIQ
ncbi:hypothetical protein OH710_16010 [Pseudomonas capsici]|uniref:hypothetical protein n=1 Tax=Pseudomonas capsici TaxID=2810614 RepID=UPI0021F1C510|nr:hypothetical protein [Pseudomonas capsici]MCV4274147.1 hypothetical protein [Pseudomonas capsici]